MRKLVFWSLVGFMCLGVLFSGGCGGSADSSSGSESTDIPNNNPESYNTAQVLEGNWEVLDKEIIIDVDYDDDSSLNMYLVTASMDFSGTDIADTHGSSNVTLHESWRVIRNDTLRTYLGIITINLDNELVKMVKSGADNWRCELFDEFNTVINIEILADDIIRLTEHRLALLSGDKGIEYDNVMTFRKK